MKSCAVVKRQLGELVAHAAAELPAEIREHLGGCPACARALGAARLSKGLLAAAADATEPPAHFADRVLAVLPRAKPSRTETEMWRLGWGLVPAFATALILLVVLYQYEARGIASPAGLLSLDGLSTSEQLALGSSTPDSEEVLTAVLEGDQT